jgi:hypothetical protein
LGKISEMTATIFGVLYLGVLVYGITRKDASINKDSI